MNQIAKNNEVTLTQADQDVLQALQEYREYKAGTRELKTRVINTPPAPDAINVVQIRQRVGLSQTDFAARYGFRKRTIQEWEQKRRTPEGAARILLLLIAERPDVVEEVLTLPKSTISHIRGRAQAEEKQVEESAHYAHAR